MQQDYLKEQLLQNTISYNINELVIHEKYGVGKFLGIQKMQIQNNYHECARLMYANDNFLYIPVENMYLIKRYGYNNGVLDYLGSKNWDNRRKKAKKLVENYSYELLQMVEKRQKTVLNKNIINEDNLNRFLKLSNFQYTEDQIKCLSQIKEDIKQGKLIHRLICGDVGSGKTEIAIITAFIVLDLDPTAQILFLCPTTILCRQHFICIQSRFAKYSSTIAELSSLNKNQKNVETIDLIKRGKINIIVGTHSLLSPKVSFNNLKMCIIDEENCFGVKQKSSLTNIQYNTHVLLLSATPIPRTLQMCLSAIQDISVINQKPFEEDSITVEQINKDDVEIKHKIYDEINKQGQVFYVIPKIEKLLVRYNEIANLVPELQVEYIHGQMNKAAVNHIMKDFTEKKINVLLATTLISYGIDIHNANTMFVEEGKALGLAQLYQLRGRIGRSGKESKMFFIKEKDEASSQIEYKIEIIQKLGSSSHLALAKQDLDHRGAGNVIGTNQSGHYKDIGIELYYEMLHDALQKDRCITSTEKVIPIINPGVSVFISDEYMKDDSDKIYFYNKISKSKNDNQENIIYQEIEKLYGTLPQETKNLFLITKIRRLCQKIQIEKINVSKNALSIFFTSILDDIQKSFIEIIIKILKTKKVFNTIKIIKNKVIIVTYLNSNQEVLNILSYCTDEYPKTVCH